MIVDSSAIIAILKRESDAQDFADLIEDAEVVKIPAPTILEVSLAAGRDRSDHVDEFMREAEADIVPFEARHAGLARHAFLTYGQGSGSQAHLNFGDCMVYAVAKDSDEPLMFKGDDFTHTDVTPAR